MPVRWKVDLSDMFCYVNKFRFAILRSISDGEGASMDYATFAEKAALQSILVVIDFIQRADELQA